MYRTRCPTCDAVVEAANLAAAPTYPFCSERCRLADLFRWFTEDYRVPGEPAGEGRAPDAGEAR